MVNRRRLSQLIRRLIAIDSQNPPGNEAAIARFVASYLRKMGLKPEFHEFAPDRTNVLCRIPGKGGKSLVLTPHLDTVPAGKNWKRDPFSAKLENGRLYGLGATDCKGNLAVTLEAMQSLVEDNVTLGFDLLFAATADEESGSGLGLAPLLDKKILRADAAVVLDTEDGQIIAAQKGLLHLKLRVQGKRSHGAYPHLGVNAITATAAIIGSLSRHRFAYKPNKHLRPPTVNVGTIKGGDKVNVVPDWCEVELDFRFLPGTRAESIVAELRKIAARSRRRFTIEITGVQKPYVISESHPLVSRMKQAMASGGVRPQVTGSEGATVISFFQAHGIPSVATGFGTSGCCHIADEYVVEDNLAKGARVIAEFLRTFSFERGR